MLESCI